MVGMTQAMLGRGAATPTEVNIIGASVSAVGASSGGTQALYGLTSGGLEQTKEGSAALSTINTWLLSGAAGMRGRSTT